jgi:hypothetical protein
MQANRLLHKHTNDRVAQRSGLGLLHRDKEHCKFASGEAIVRALAIEGVGAGGRGLIHSITSSTSTPSSCKCARKGVPWLLSNRFVQRSLLTCAKMYGILRSAAMCELGRNTM